MRNPRNLTVELLRWFIYATCAILVALAFSCAHQESVTCPASPFYLDDCVAACAPMPPLMAIEDKDGAHCLCKKAKEQRDPT